MWQQLLPQPALRHRHALRPQLFPTGPALCRVQLRAPQQCAPEGADPDGPVCGRVALPHHLGCTRDDDCDSDHQHLGVAALCILRGPVRAGGACSLDSLALLTKAAGQAEATV